MDKFEPLREKMIDRLVGQAGLNRATAIGVLSVLEEHDHLSFSMQKNVERFMKIGDQAVREYPSAMDVFEHEANLRIKLMREELDGKLELTESIERREIVGIADGIADLLYVVLGTAATYGIEASGVFAEAHKSNMTKCVWDEPTQGWTVIKNEDGKVLKPKTYQPANFVRVVNEQGIAYSRRVG